MDELFRQEAIEHRASRLLGEISLAQPLSWTIAGALLALGVAGAAAALVLIETPRLATARAVLIDGRAEFIAPAGAAVGAAVRVRPEIVGRDVDLTGRIVAIARQDSIHRFAGRTVAGRRARASVDRSGLPDGTTAQAIITLGREPLGAALF